MLACIPGGLVIGNFKEGIILLSLPVYGLIFASRALMVICIVKMVFWRSLWPDNQQG